MKRRSALIASLCWGANVVRGSSQHLRGSGKTPEENSAIQPTEAHENRKLMSGMFEPLDCNAGLDQETCVTWSSQGYGNAPTTEVVIPCGTCVTMENITGDVVLGQGLHVVGKLHIPPPSSKLTISTPHIFVQGDLSIDAPDSVIPSEKMLEFVITGSEDEVFVPKNTTTQSSFTSKKPIVVAGGQLNIHGMDFNTNVACPTWTRLASIETFTPTASPTSGSQVAPIMDGTTVDFTAGGSVSFDAVDDSVTFQSSSGADAIVLTKDAYGNSDGSGNLEITVEYLAREELSAGYQSALSLFFADENDTIDMFNANDNNYGNFESATVATVKDKMYPSMGHVWFSMKNKATDGTTASTSGSATYKMTTGGKFKLRRSNGYISSYHYQNSDWVQIGTDQELPDSYKTSPLKVGMRVKKEWLSDYNMKLLPTITTTPEQSDEEILDVSKNIITLEDDVTSCWGVGAEIMITSSTIEYEDVYVSTIESIDPTTGQVTLTEAIADESQVISLADDAITGVEVALLNRNIIFRAEEDTMNPDIGGHLIFMKTPTVAQTLIGAEMNNFGQQGNLGRYPIHFHMSNSVAGSVVKKNLIRSSNQRCVVIHNSDDVEVVENVAYETHGHCFILEDGSEQNNKFIRNLGASTRAVQTLISDAESDNIPSTFWITNPNNTWIGNVAAGSGGPGFWFEVSPSVRGPSKAMHPDMKPSYLPLQLFIDNVSHSNGGRAGLQTYPQSGYRPPEQAVFKNHKSYRNKNNGVFFHAGGRLTVDGGYFADNKIAVNIDGDHSDEVLNSIIIGVSDTYQKIVDAIGPIAYLYPYRSQCNEPMDGVVKGIILDSYFNGGTRATGTKVSNVTFSGFGPSKCANSAAVESHGHYYYYFDPRNTLEEISFLDDSTPVNLCVAHDEGQKDVAIYDKDGSILEGQGFIVSDSDIMKADPRCSSVAGTCAAYCPNVCMRSLTVAVPSSTSPYIKLHVEGTLPDGTAINPVTFMSYKREPADPTAITAHRIMHVTLPAGGSYTARFTEGDGQETIWPTYASTSYEDTPNECGADFALFDIEQPAASCDELVLNGDAGETIAGGSIEHWRHEAGGVQVAEDGADGSNYSLLSINTNPGGKYYALAQYLDTRCMIEGNEYAFRALVKLTNQDDTSFQCNVGAWSSDPASCPGAILVSMHGLTDSEAQWPSAGSMKESDKEWNVMEGKFTVSAFDAAAGTVALRISGAPAGVNIQIDQVSITPVEETEPPTASPTESPDPVPSNLPPLHQLSADYTPGSVSFDGDAVIFSSSTGQDATILSSIAFPNNVEIMVEYLGRDIFGSGYQAALALFFADENEDIEAVTTNDNSYGAFESTAVASIKDRMYPTIDHVWFSMKNRGVDGSIVNTSGGGGYKMMTGGKFKLSRSNGFASAYHYYNGGWAQIGAARELPDLYKTAPLKVGMRIKKEWKSEYLLKVLPTVTTDTA